MTAPRSLISLRVKPDALATIQALAEAEGRSTSDMIRRLLAEALAARQRKPR